MTDKHYVLIKDEGIFGIVGESCRHYAPPEFERKEVTSKQIFSLLRHGKDLLDGSVKISSLIL